MGIARACGDPKQSLHTLFYITGDSRKKGANMKSTQHEEILKYFKSHKTITPMEAFSHLGITKLATRVSEMKRNGYVFKQEMIEVQNRHGATVRVMQYEFMGRISDGTFLTANEVLESVAA